MAGIEDFTLSTFSEQMNSRFHIVSEGSGNVELELVEATDLGGAPRQTQFSICFRGPLEKPLVQGCYPFQHEQLGAFELFLVPIGIDDSGLSYEAVFNRVVRK